jgi:hypothetical protein
LVLRTCVIGGCSQCCHAEATHRQRNGKKKFSSGLVDNQGRDEAAKHLNDPNDDCRVVGADGNSGALYSKEQKNIEN